VISAAGSGCARRFQFGQTHQRAPCGAACGQARSQVSTSELSGLIR
jgi:hypothetical protein